MFARIAALLLAVAPSLAHAQSSPSAYTYATRYDGARRATGTIAPDPDGSGPLKYLATRTTYDAGGRPITVEKGQLTDWQSESVAPSTWPVWNQSSGFQIFSKVVTTWDALDHKLTEAAWGSTDGGATWTESTLTQYSYDSLGRLDCTAERLNPATWTSPPASACTPATAGTYGPDRITKNTYDAADQVLKVTKAYGTSLQQDYATYTYTSNGKQASVKDADGNLASYTYDGFDRLTQWNFPDKVMTGSVSSSDYETYGYDANGNRTSLRKRDGRTFTLTYDALNRLTAKSVPGACAFTGPLCTTATRAVYYGYDLRGLQLYARFDSASGADGVMSGYDGFGRLTSSTTAMGGVSRTFGYTYDANGNRLSIMHPDGAVFTYDYDGLDRLTAVHPPGSSIPIATYNAAGYQTKRTILETLGYDGIGRLASKTFTWNGTDNYTLGLTYNPASQIVSRTQSARYAFTGYVDVSRSYAMNGLNQYTAAGPATFGYDANGNLTGDGTSTFSYDAENRLVTKSGGLTLDYDPLGRLWRTSGGASGTTQYLYDGDQLTVEYDGSGTVLRRYMHGPGDDDPLLSYEGSSTANTAWRILVPDYQGSIIGTFANSGATVGINTYDEYGIPAATNIGRFQYTGQAWLPDLGMYYYKARIYSPTLGRFLQTDPVGYADQNNLYVYVGNDPVNGRDSDGNQQEQMIADYYMVSKAATYNSNDPNAGIKAVTELNDQVLTTLSLILIPELAVRDIVVVAPVERPGLLTRIWRGITGLFGRESETDWIVTREGTTVRPSVSRQRAEFESTGMTGRSATGRGGRGTAENGTIHTTPDGQTDIRLMDGSSRNSPRAVTTRAGTGDGVRPNGDRFPNGTPKQIRKDGSHLEFPK